MKPPPFRYHAPDTLEEALSLLAEYGDEAKPLAGGQSLVPAMSFRLARPSVLVDLSRLRDFDAIGHDGDELSFGAMCRQRAIERSPLVAAHQPLLTGVLPHVAHPQIRNRGTIGGSLAHADPAAELPAVLIATGGRCLLRSASGGERWVGADDFYTGLFETAGRDDELLCEVRVRTQRQGGQSREGWGFHEFARRHGDYALVGVVAVIRTQASRIEEARIALLSVGDGPVHAARAGDLLRGLRLDDEAGREEAIREAARTVAYEEIDPPGDLQASPEYRRHLAEVLTRRALKDAFKGALS